MVVVVADMRLSLTSTEQTPQGRHGAGERGEGVVAVVLGGGLGVGGVG